MLRSVRDKVAPLVKAGQTLEQVVAAKPTQEHDAKWGGGFLKPDQFVGIVYASLKKAK
jgi:cyclase